MRPTTLMITVAITSLFGSAAAVGDTVFNSRIQSSARGYNGIMTINQASGVGQQQVNARALAAGCDAQAVINVEQTRGVNTSDHLQINTSAHIKGDSFSRGNGVLGVNQGAGINNQQINAFRIEMNSMPESLDDSRLALSAAPSSIVSGAVAPHSGQRQVSIDDQAFADSRGVVQLNQSAGVGNRMVNNLGVRIMK